MWLASLCVTNQLLKDTFVDLHAPDLILSKEVDAPMDDNYRMLMLLPPKSSAQQERLTSWSEVICPVTQKQENTSITNTALPSKISLTVEFLSEKGDSVSKQQFEPTCPRPKHEDSSTLFLGAVKLQRGTYKLNVTNNSALPIDVLHHTQVLLMGQGVGFP